MNPRPPDCKSPSRTSSGFLISPATLDWDGFREWLKAKYSKKYAWTVHRYAKRYFYMFQGNLGEVETFGRAKRRIVLSSLIALSKYLGVYEAFKRRMKNYGLKWESQSSFESFMRILRESKSDVLGWVKRCLEAFDKPYAMFVKFALISGLRKTEAIEAFNLAVKLGKAGSLSEYYNRELQTLEHFRYPEKFIRGSKNVFFSIIPSGFLASMVECGTVSDSGYKRRLKKAGLPSRIKDLRDYYATFMLQHGLFKEEVDLIQGRIGKTIFMKHYFSPSIRDLCDRTLKAVRKILRINHI
ncbi:hypothetical protein J7L06_06010 [Candidatus Bathyarchaeota archaeon]|nr:hypothetical protein [Candidatus Bathyarchaeota archaeon]